MVCLQIIESFIVSFFVTYVMLIMIYTIIIQDTNQAFLLLLVVFVQEPCV